LGATYLQMARALEDEDECAWKWGLLDKATEAHQQALDAPSAEKPVSGNVDYRARFGLGRADFWRGYCYNGELWKNATLYYTRVLTDYTTLREPQSQITDLAALASTDLGFMELLKATGLERRAGDLTAEEQSMLEKSIGYYQQAFALIEQTKSSAALKHGINNLRFYLTGLCLNEQGAEAKAALDRFVGLFDDPAATTTAALELIDTELWAQCQAAVATP
jgi:hypothetical protein